MSRTTLMIQMVSTCVVVVGFCARECGGGQKIEVDPATARFAVTSAEASKFYLLKEGRGRVELVDKRKWKLWYVDEKR